MSDLFHSLSGSDWLFELLICFFLIVGGIFCLGGSIGLMRFPDVYCKMQALSKPVTLGIFNLIIAYILFLVYAGIGLSLKGLLAMVFLLLTVPIGTHMLAKAAYRSGVPIWTESIMDQLAGASDHTEENREAQLRAEVITDIADQVLTRYSTDWTKAPFGYSGAPRAVTPPKSTGKRYKIQDAKPK